jgi:hypothetical protein
LTLPVSSPGLTGRSSKHRPWILDCPVKPGNDSLEDINPIEIRSSERTSA